MDLFVSFMDLEKAYDSANTDELWKRLEEKVLRKLKERSEVGREEVGELDISV